MLAYRPSEALLALAPDTIVIADRSSVALLARALLAVMVADA